MYQHQFGRIGLGTTPATMGGDPGMGFDPASMSMSLIGTVARPPTLGQAASPSPMPNQGAPVPTQPWNRPPSGQWGSQGDHQWMQDNDYNRGNPWQNNWQGSWQEQMRSNPMPAPQVMQGPAGMPGAPRGPKLAMGGTNGFRGAMSGGVRA